MDIKRAVIEINGDCNYSCNMCVQSKGRGEFSRTISLTDYKRLVLECLEMKVEVIQLEGSGEATLMKDLPEYIKFASDLGIKVQIYSNGFLMKDKFMKDCVDAGLSLFRFSVLGYNTETYKKMMNNNNFNTVIQNIKEMKKYIKKTNSTTKISLYHLAEDKNSVDLFVNNVVNKLNILAEIWKMHNWSGVLGKSKRKGIIQSCGRPNAPEITIRAGGNDGRKLAVVPCCQTLGNDHNAVLSYCDNSTVKEAFNSDRYNWLRKMHDEERFDEIDFCKDCDFLIKDNSVLMWTNISTIYQMNGLEFKLK